MNRKVLGFLALWCGLAWGSVVGSPAHARLESPQPLVRWQDALLDMLGGGRTVLARLFWFTMDMLHEQQEKRGVNAFRETELVPLLRMITFLDPHLWDAYDTLAYDLDRGYGQRSKAVALVDEGLKFNPDEFALNYRRGELSTRQGRWGKAVPFFIHALSHADTDTQRLAALRSIIHCAENLQDPMLGLRTLSALEAMMPGTRTYDRQRARWQEEMKLPQD